MNQPEQADPVETMLREQNQYINDDGFTARVMTALPRRRRPYYWLRPALLLGAAAVGTALAIRWLPWESLSAMDLSALLSLDFQAMAPWLSVALVSASILWAVVAAVEWED